MTHLLLFEPWGLGDLVVASNFARTLKNDYGYETSICCSEKWSSWIINQKHFRDIIYFDAAWTEKKGKYNISNYSLKDILDFSSVVRSGKYDLIWDVRGDIRHRVFLTLTCGQKVYSINSQRYENVYERLKHFLTDHQLDKLNLSQSQKLKNDPKKVISIFTGAGWTNRKLPSVKAIQVIRKIINLNYTVQFISDFSQDSYDVREEFMSDSGFMFIESEIISEVEEQIISSDYIITTDTSWMHLAYYNHIPIIALFAAKNANEWAPPGTKVIFCDNPIPANKRYKQSNEDKTPLNYLDDEVIIRYLKNSIHG